jgi:hypothetical protein
MQLIREYGDRYNNPDDRTGYGIPNFYQCYLDHVNSVPENKMPAISVYPNPTNGELRIIPLQELKGWTAKPDGVVEFRIESVEIFDVFGRKQMAESRRQKAESEMVMDISHLTPGVYIIKVVANGNISTHKIIKH